MALKLNKFRAKLNSKGTLSYNKKELAGCFDEICTDKNTQGKPDEQEIDLIVLSARHVNRKQNKSQSKTKIAANKISQVEFLSKKLNLDENSTFLLLSSFGSLKSITKK